MGVDNGNATLSVASFTSGSYRIRPTAYVSINWGARLYFTQQDSNVPLQMDGLRLLNLPTSGYNLPNGTVFQVGEDLRIVVPNISYLFGVSATASVGTETVTV